MNHIHSDHPVRDAVTHIESALRDALDARGRAVLMLSGGSSPRPVHEALSEVELDWSRVHVGLVDDRVDPAGSNADFVRETLLKNRATAATFHPMKEGGFADLMPADMCVMGMGSDGHTASWFPETKDLAKAMDVDTDEIVVAVDSESVPGAGDYRYRLTLTLPAVMQSRNILLFIPGAKKREVFENREGLPVDALTASDRLTVITGDV